MKHVTKPWLSEGEKINIVCPHYGSPALNGLERKGLIIRHFEFVYEANMSEESYPTRTPLGKRIARQLGEVIPG
jgi:hypothetical protein